MTKTTPQTQTERVQYVYDYVNTEMAGNDAFTSDMIEDMIKSADMAYWRLSRAQRRSIVGR